MLKIKSNLRKVATMIAYLAVTTMLIACDKDDGNGGNGKNSIVGMWRCYYADLDGVIIFNEDGTFCYLSMQSSLSYFTAWHCRGNYKITGETIEGSKLERLAISAFGTNTQTTPDAVAEVRNIIQTGSKNKLLELLSPTNPLYRQNGLYSWGEYNGGSKSGKLIFENKDKITMNLFQANNEFNRVK